MRLKWRWRSDWEGRPLRAGDWVRVCAIPSLKGMSKQGIKESLPAFRHALGRTFFIRHFNDYGCAGMDFAIPFGEHRGMHSIYVEVALLKLVRRSTTPPNAVQISGNKSSFGNPLRIRVPK